ncbi:MAG: peptidase S14 [Ruminococcaceae bacterium]|nr:peptidase S14 [Oscillospiraceae bacterium]
MSNNENNHNEKSESIKEFGAVTSFSGKHKIYCLTIIGEIEGHNVLPEQSKTTKYEHIIPQLVAVEESQEIEGLLVILNTVGGDVEAGLAIAELISGMKKPTVSFVLGGGHSIGVPLAVSAKKSFIAPSATMTVHPVRTNGLVIGVPQMFNHFAKMQERITNFVARNSKISKESFTSLMMNTGEMVTDVGSVLSGERAVETGLIDSIGTLSDVLEGLYKLIEETDKESCYGNKKEKQ